MLNKTSFIEKPGQEVQTWRVLTINKLNEFISGFDYSPGPFKTFIEDFVVTTKYRTLAWKIISNTPKLSKYFASYMLISLVVLFCFSWGLQCPSFFCFDYKDKGCFCMSCKTEKKMWQLNEPTLHNTKCFHWLSIYKYILRFDLPVVSMN